MLLTQNNILGIYLFGIIGQSWILYLSYGLSGYPTYTRLSFERLLFEIAKNTGPFPKRVFLSHYPPPPPPCAPPPHPRALALGRAPITWGGGVGIMGMSRQKDSVLKDPVLKWACLLAYIKTGSFKTGSCAGWIGG